MAAQQYVNVGNGLIKARRKYANIGVGLQSIRQEYSNVGAGLQLIFSPEVYATDLIIWDEYTTRQGQVTKTGPELPWDFYETAENDPNILANYGFQLNTPSTSPQPEFKWDVILTAGHKYWWHVMGGNYGDSRGIFQQYFLDKVVQAPEDDVIDTAMFVTSPISGASEIITAVYRTTDSYAKVWQTDLIDCTETFGDGYSESEMNALLWANCRGQGGTTTIEV